VALGRLTLSAAPLDLRQAGHGHAERTTGQQDLRHVEGADDAVLDPVEHEDSGHVPAKEEHAEDG